MKTPVVLYRSLGSLGLGDLFWVGPALRLVMEVIGLGPPHPAASYPLLVAACRCYSAPLKT